MTKFNKHNILVIGSGAREHAICHKISESTYCKKLFAYPSNAGIDRIASRIMYQDTYSNENEFILDICKKNDISLVIIGPEGYLVNGLTNLLKTNNILVFGPTQEASILEGSKIYMKTIADKKKIPTASFESFDNLENACKYIELQNQYPIVIKTDGLAAGKGVLICESEAQAKQELKEIFEGKFGQAGNSVVIEQYLDGYEISAFYIVDENSYHFLGAAQDYKKIGDGDTGLNTGGMGAYTHSQLLSDTHQKQIENDIVTPILEGMKEDNRVFTGILFVGLMICESQPYLLEYNIRFGDPETQTILNNLKTDLGELILHATHNSLNDIDIEFKNLFCTNVVIASKGYPETYQKNVKIDHLARLQSSLPNNIYLYHAATYFENDSYYANGGRVLSVTSWGYNFTDIKDQIYDTIKEINWEGGYYRTDIAQNILQSSY